MASQTPIPTTMAVSARAANDTASHASVTDNNIVAMTTPFVVAPDCLDFNGGTINLQSWNRAYSTITQDSAVRQRPSCLPSGVRNATYLPAVCPSGWKYYSIIPAASSTQLTTNGTPGPPIKLTSAVCCPPEYYMNFFTYTYQGPFSQNCTGHVQADQITSVIIPDGGAANQTVFTSIIGGAEAQYPPWYITWASEDIATLSPAPPRIAPHSFVPVWTPGTRPTQYNVEPYSSGGIATAALVTAIVEGKARD
ncbi:hypothetical protein NQ176_g10116 [Zarea fungicola]|uniref:Uncharacterized protein n=1 Tax=Zarea fungicola TaxID=93591 RepID=A0ACC1MIQ0_9HYPO|nr:hypothetical protein NQ176_g10116 [Lecanicillium fungicola]